MFIILAHAALGPWDEILFLGVAVIFTTFMGISWWRSRDFEPYLEDKDEGLIEDEEATPS